MESNMTEKQRIEALCKLVLKMRKLGNVEVSVVIEMDILFPFYGVSYEGGKFLDKGDNEINI